MAKEVDTPEAETRELTGEEAALYDRQIRLWGLDAQRRLAGANVLITGSTTSLLAQELAKNLVLAGIAALTLTAAEDSIYVTGGFLGKDSNACATSLADINPLVKVSVRDSSSASKPVIDPACSLVCAVDCSEGIERQYAIVCREAGIPYYCGRALGPVGFFFVDLGSVYTYKVPRADTAGEARLRGPQPAEKDAAPTDTTETAIERYISYTDAVDGQWGREPPRSDCGWHVACCLRAFEDQEKRLPGSDADADAEKMLALYAALRDERLPARLNEELVEYVARTACHTLPPVSAITGGMWGREVIKALSRSDQPLNNFFFFSAKSSQGCVERVGPSIGEQ
jgi:ubiquitin-like 1-activating enzyme E1 A